MNDLKSILGYSKGSPYAGNPYLDIITPEGLIDMSNTEMDLIGIDNLGNRKKMKAGTTNPYKFEGTVVREIPMQRGGISREKLLNFLYDPEEDREEPTTAPVQEEMAEAPQEEKVVESPDDDYELALSIANQQGNPYEVPAHMQTSGNPYKSEYVNDLSTYGTAYKDIDKNVASATEELLAKFPNLRLTSGRRSWGDKDAHPQGRAVDLSYDPEAYNYYQNVLVPKYGFNKALDPNHGTGKHIHLGYY
jgi:hypothetical protein